MSSIHVISLLFWGATTLLWSMSVWGSWAGRLFEQVGPESIAWYWLRVFDVPRTRENCVHFVTIVSLVGIVLISVGVTLILLTQP